MGHVIMGNLLQRPSCGPLKGGAWRPASPANQQLLLQQLSTPPTLLPTPALGICITISSTEH